MANDQALKPTYPDDVMVLAIRYAAQGTRGWSGSGDESAGTMVAAFCDAIMADRATRTETPAPDGEVGELVDRVRAKRERNGLSVRQLAELVGVSFSTLARVERGEGEYSQPTAEKLREWLGDAPRPLLSNEDFDRAMALGRSVSAAFIEKRSEALTRLSAQRGEVKVKALALVERLEAIREVVSAAWNLLDNTANEDPPEVEQRDWNDLAAAMERVDMYAEIEAAREGNTGSGGFLVTALIEQIHRLSGQCEEWWLVEQLVADEGNAVTILCENPEGNGPDNHAIEVCGDLTNWEDRRFYGETRLAALQAAIRSLGDG